MENNKERKKQTKHFGQFWFKLICVDDMQLMLLHCLINAKYMETAEKKWREPIKSLLYLHCHCHRLYS